MVVPSSNQDIRDHESVRTQMTKKENCGEHWLLVEELSNDTLHMQE